MDKVLEFLNSFLKINDTIVVACSGGPDSMGLLDIIGKLRDKYNLKIVCAHVNHNVRKISDDEAIMVQKYCKENNIIFEYYKIENYGKENFHQQARKIRYNFFEELVNKYSANYLFTAHHGDDLMETILMRICRGSILKGYKGIETISIKDNYKVVRPLLSLTKSQMLEYVKNNNIPYAVDESNNEDHYTRNRYRHNVLPFLKSENALVHLKFKDFSDELSLYDDFVDKYIEDKNGKIYSNNSIKIDLFLKEHELIQQKIIEKILNDIYDGYLDIITKKHVTNILKFIKNNSNNKYIDLPNNYVLEIEYDVAKFHRKKECNNFEYILDKDVNEKKYSFKYLDKCDEKSNYVLRLNSNELKLPLKVRNKKIGDKIEVKNLNQFKKLSDVFTNEKIKKDVRENIPIVLDSNENILWIPGIKKSSFDKEKTEKYDIIIKYILKEEEENE